MASDAAPKKGFGLFKAALGGGVGLATGVIGVYATAIVDKVAKPPKPVANFAVSADGLTVTCQNHASGQSGWWDFGDGTPLEPFDPEQKEVPHTYAKPGHYGVKLVVRNFLNEENDRTAPVDVTLAPTGGGPTAGGPAVVGLSVEPVAGSRTAPAMFTVKYEVKNAQQTVLDLGSGQKPEGSTATGMVEKKVVYEQPGVYPLQVYAVNGSAVEKQWKAVEVKPPPAGALSVVAKVTDSGGRAVRKTVPVTVTVPVPPKPAGAFDRPILPEPGATIAEATLDPKYANKAVKNLKVVVAPDKKSAKLTGEWTGTAGPEPLVPVAVVQERVTAIVGPPQTVSAHLLPPSVFDAFDGKSADLNGGVKTAALALPPTPAGAVNARRTIALQVHEMDAAGQDRVILNLPDLGKPTDEHPVTLSNRQRHVVRWETLPTGQLRVTVRPATSLAGR
jgi:PKD repeat protein